MPQQLDWNRNGNEIVNLVDGQDLGFGRCLGLLRGACFGEALVHRRTSSPAEKVGRPSYLEFAIGIAFDFCFD